jgi:hypothetical protein
MAHGLWRLKAHNRPSPPDFLTVQNAGPLPPFTSMQKFKVVTRSSLDYVEYPWYGALAGIGQAEKGEPGFGQGAAGYAMRYRASFADGRIENFMTSAVLQSLLREDPRFYQPGTRTSWLSPRQDRLPLSRKRQCVRLATPSPDPIGWRAG